MKIRKHQIHFFILLFAMCSLLFHPPLDFEANATDGWYDDSWDYRKKITASLDTVIDSDLTDFPYLVSVTDSDLTKAAESDGSDIVFIASDDTTELAYEMEKFDQSTGEIIAWIKIPTVSGSENTDIYMYYKGTSTSDSSSVWDDNYKLVYHLNQTASGTVGEFTDVSGNGNDGIAGGTGLITQKAGRQTTQVEAKIGYGQSFDGPTQTANNNQGSGDYIWVNKVQSWPTGDSTVEFWTKINSGQSGLNEKNFFNYCVAGSAESKENQYEFVRGDKMKMKMRNQFYVSSQESAATSSWIHIMAVYEIGGTSILYKNGEVVKSQNNSFGHTIIGGGSFALGGDIDHSSQKCKIVNNEFIGDMDEFRISNTLRSADWAAASYCNQNGSNDCQTIGPEEPRPLPPTSDTSSPCSKHVILGNCGTIAINNDVYSIIHTRTNVPTTEVLVGEPVTITLSTPNNPTYTKIYFASVFTEIFNSPTNYEQSTHVDYSVMNSKVTYVSQSQLFQVAGATHRITEDPNTKNLDWFEVVFTMIFAKPMDTSHVVVETVNKFGIPETLYLTSALKVNENLPQALTLEEKSKFELEYKQGIIPEMTMDQEPDIDKVTCGKGTVLKDNLCVPKEWSFLDFFKQLMKLFG